MKRSEKPIHLKLGTGPAGYYLIDTEVLKTLEVGQTVEIREAHESAKPFKVLVDDKTDYDLWFAELM